MTDREALFSYRINQSAETLAEAEKMLKDNYSPRTIVNRAYYSMFYLLLALFIKCDINLQTSKHSGIISIFDKEFVRKGIFDKKYSITLHTIFDLRMEYDYKELTEVLKSDANDAVLKAKEFFKVINDYIKS